MYTPDDSWTHYTWMCWDICLHVFPHSYYFSLSSQVLGDIELAQNMQSERDQVAKDVSISPEQWFQYNNILHNTLG